MQDELSQTKWKNQKQPVGVKARDQLSLPRLNWIYANQKVWDFRSKKSWHIDTILKIVWHPVLQGRTYQTGVEALDYILDNYPVKRKQIKKHVQQKGFSWITTRNVVLPRLKKLGIIHESSKQITPKSDVALFFKKLANEWLRELADHDFLVKGREEG